MNKEDKKAEAQAKSVESNDSGKQPVSVKQRAAARKAAAEEKKDYELTREVTIDGEKVPAGEPVSLTEDGRRYFKSKFYIK